MRGDRFEAAAVGIGSVRPWPPADGPVEFELFLRRRQLRSAALPFALILQASSPVLSSYYFDRVGNYDGAFFTIAALAIVAMLLVLLAKRPTRPDEVLAPA